MTNAAPSGGPPPRAIYLLRHGEKPTQPDHAPYGVDSHGEQSYSSLIPRGWQRAGGLATLFDTAVGTMRTDLLRPRQLYAPDYGDAKKTVSHRTYETILPLSLRLAAAITATYAEADGKALGQRIVSNDTGVSLVCWEHDHIPCIVEGIPLGKHAGVPTVWPEGRFDVIWAFTLSGTEYSFAALPELLLDGDGPA